MKCVWFSIFVVVAIQLLPSCEAKLCLKQSHCDSDQCCTKIPFMMGAVCRKRPKEDEDCSVLSRGILDEKFFVGLCPCAEGLRCEKGDSLIEKVKGKCVKDTDVVDTESPDIDEDIE